MAASYEPELLLQHAAHVRALARRVVFDAELAQDVEQETWLAALKHAPRDLRDPRAWLARVVRHAASRQRKRRERRSEHELRAGAERAAGGGEPADDPSGLAEREQALRSLLAAVGRLPEPVRRAVVLHHLDGLTLGEVARRTEAPLETVRSRVKRGLELLRADLARERGSAAWSVFLVRAFELAPPAGAGHGLALVFREALLSLTLMSSTLKLGAGAAALLLLVGFLLFERSPPREPELARTDPSLSVVEPPSGAAITDAERTLDARRASPSEPAPLVSAQRPAPTTGKLALRVTWADDRTPADTVLVRIEALDSAERERAWVTTSSDGLALRDGLAPGRHVASTLHGGLAFVAIVAGETCEAELVIPLGIAVDGRVETREGAPVRGAEIFLYPGATEQQYEGGIVARTDAGGRFTLRSAAAGVGACLSARAAGFVPSEQVMLTGAPHSRVELTLVLTESGRALAGQVLSPAGVPVANAEVLVGAEYEWIARRRDDGTMARSAIGQLASTDSAGGFSFAGVPLASVLVQVRAAGYAPWRGELAEDEPQPWTIRLQRGASVSGTVRGADGTPLAGMRVRSEPARDFASLEAESAADGSYRLEELPPGELTLLVERRTNSLQLGGAARAKTTLTLIAGAEQRWDPVVPLARELRGRVEAPGMALDDWIVRGWRDSSAAGESNYVEEARTDAEGRFVLVQPPEDEVDLALFRRGGSAFPLARAAHVPTAGPEVVLRPDPALMPTCFIRGALVDASGEPVRSADIVAWNPALGSLLVHPDANDGTFELGPLPSSEWTLDIDPLAAEWAVARLTRVLAPSERWDAGKVKLGLGGTLAVRLVLAAGVEPAKGATAELRDLQDRPVARLELADDSARSGPVAPGTYRLVLAGAAAGLAPAREVVIVAGQETSVAIELQPPRRK